MTAVAQAKYYAEQSSITFFSDGDIEDIKANNTSVTSIFDVTKKEIAFLLKVKDFEFDKKLMQVHFNEKYMEAEKYPKSTFIGSVTGYNLEREGVQHVTASGKLSIHGVTRDVKIPGTIEKKGRNLMLRSKFMIKLSDYKISIPQIIWKNVAEEVEVDLDLVYTPL
jgi:polyisoprenoid-binding protein YceI